LPWLLSAESSETTLRRAWGCPEPGFIEWYETRLQAIAEADEVTAEPGEHHTPDASQTQRSRLASPAALHQNNRVSRYWTDIALIDR
jgi:hypothetical protein